MIRYLLVIIVGSLFFGFKSEKNVAFEVRLHWGERQIHLNDLIMYEGDSIQISQFKIYLSNIRFLNEGKTVYKLKNQYHLVDFSDESTTVFSHNIPAKKAYDQVVIGIGVDSVKSVSGAFGGDLDPTNGMYWAWNSGYINWKMEGTIEGIPTRGNQFQCHIGGYQGKDKTYHDRVHHWEGRKMFMVINLKKIVPVLIKREKYEIMIPGENAVSINEVMIENLSVHE